MIADCNATPASGPVLRAVREAVSIASSMGTLQPSILVSGIVINILGMALPLAMLQIFDRIIPHAAFSTLTMLVIGLGVALVLETLLRQVRASINAWEGARFDHRTSVALVGKLLDAPSLEVESRAVGAHLDRLNSVEPVRDFYGQQFSMMLSDLPFVVIFLGLIYYIGGALVLAPIGLIAVYALLAWGNGHALHEALRERKEFDGRRYNFIVEVLSSIHTAKGLAIERVLQRRYERLIASGAAPGWRVNFLSSISEGFANGFSQMTSVTVGGFGAMLVINGQMTVGALAASTMLAGRSVQPLLRSLGLWTRYQSVRLSVEQLKTIEAMPSEPMTTGELVGPIDKVELRDVSFRYGPDLPLLYDGASLTVERGETIGLNGCNGCGKTTLLGMLMGSQAPTSGSLEINERPIGPLNRASLRYQIAYIPQRAVLFKGSILENMTRFDVDANLEQALDLAARLGLDRFFAGLPDGYEMMVNDGATAGLPSGVVQRIGMVRALVGDPRLILFDEANSSLDHDGDKLVRDLLITYKPNSAMIVVSFRPSLLAIADRQLSIRGGLIVPSDRGAQSSAKVAA